jgi:GNAT superfamily N-acetyltransferase
MIPEKWQWQYLHNPRGPKSDGYLPIWIAQKDNEIVGQLATIPVKMKLGGEVVMGAWGVDLIVLPSCRGEGLGSRLVQEVVNANRVYMAVEMSAITKRIYDRLGYVALRPVSVFGKFMEVDGGSLSDIIQKLSIGRPWLSVIHRFLSFRPVFYFPMIKLLNLLLRSRDWIWRTSCGDGQILIREVDGFGGWVDHLQRNAQRYYDSIVLRDRTFLTWRFIENPQTKYNIFTADRGGEIVGFSVLRRSEGVEKNRGFIVDLFAVLEDTKIFEALINHAICYFRGYAPIIECPSSADVLQNSFKKYGFIKLRESIPYAYSTEPSILKRLESSGNNWFLTRGDSDWDSVIPTQQSQQQGFVLQRQPSGFRQEPVRL